jgi:NAD(P)-dependent dehydrogenase (short-subunit alcohol dehydrogenase family)
LTAGERLRGRIALVTGGGSGIGAAVATRLAREGAHVAVTDRDQSAAQRTVDGLGSSTGAAEAFALDVADAAQVDDAVARVRARLGPPAILVNNAGIFDGMTPLEELTDELWDKVVRINLTGPMRVTRSVLPAMLGAGTGAIVNVASTAGLVSMGGGTAYTVSKFGLVGLTRQVAVEVAGRGVRVNAVAPGLVASLPAYSRTRHRCSRTSGRTHHWPRPASTA